VLAESTRPASITVAAMSGARWRSIDVPPHAQAKRWEDQLAWVGWCVQDHFRESKGRSFLFGSIQSYLYYFNPKDWVEFDPGGNLIGERVKQPDFAR
jgi:hypothetical protein